MESAVAQPIRSRWQASTMLRVFSKTSMAWASNRRVNRAFRSARPARTVCEPCSGQSARGSRARSGLILQGIEGPPLPFRTKIGDRTGPTVDGARHFRLAAENLSDLDARGLLDDKNLGALPPAAQIQKRLEKLLARIHFHEPIWPGTLSRSSSYPLELKTNQF